MTDRSARATLENLPLQPGKRLSRDDSERRYDAMPHRHEDVHRSVHFGGMRLDRVAWLQGNFFRVLQVAGERGGSRSHKDFVGRLGWKVKLDSRAEDIDAHNRGDL